MKKRSRAREVALQYLYQHDLLQGTATEDLPEFLREQDEDAEVRRFARDLVEGTVETRAGLDAEIQAVAQNWQISRMAVIDRNILRMAAYEMLHTRDVPPKVAINEAIELGKRYSTEKSGAFVNGILDRIKTRAQAVHAAAGVAADATLDDSALDNEALGSRAGAGGAGAGGAGAGGAGAGGAGDGGAGEQG